MQKALKTIKAINLAQLILMVIYTFLIPSFIWEKYVDFFSNIYCVFLYITTLMFIPSLLIIILGFIKGYKRLAIINLTIGFILFIFTFFWIGFWSL